MICPFCCGQGEVLKATITKTNENIYICDECDTIWLDKNIEEYNCLRFDDYMEKLQLNPIWSELSNISKLTVDDF